MTMDHMSVLSKDDSYAERRKLFKNVWETTIQLDEKEPDNGTKSKIIKTLRVDKCNSGKSKNCKKRRIKHLRTVCTRLLSSCDRQDAADLLSDKDQISADCEESKNSAVILPPKEKRKKKHRKKKTPQTYTYLRPQDRQTKTKTSFELEVPDGSVTHRGTRPLRGMHSPIVERATLIEKFLNERYNIEKAPAPAVPEDSLQVGDAPCKVVKKKKRKKKNVNPIPSPPVPVVQPPSPPPVKSPHTKGVHNRSSKRKKELVK